MKNRSPTTSYFRRAASKLDFMQRDIDDWKITFVDTGHAIHDRRPFAAG